MPQCRRPGSFVFERWCVAGDFEETGNARATPRDGLRVHAPYQGTRTVAFRTQREGFQTLTQHPGIERTRGRVRVAGHEVNVVDEVLAANRRAAEPVAVASVPFSVCGGFACARRWFRGIIVVRP